MPDADGDDVVVVPLLLLAGAVPVEEVVVAGVVDVAGVVLGLAVLDDAPVPEGVGVLDDAPVPEGVAVELDPPVGPGLVEDAPDGTMLPDEKIEELDEYPVGCELKDDDEKILLLGLEEPLGFKVKLELTPVPLGVDEPVGLME